MQRRRFLLVFGLGSLVSACQSGPPKPATLVLNVAGQKGMNPAPDGSDRPVTVLVMRLRSTGKFDSADYFSLQSNAAGTLGADLIGSDTVAVAPGKVASKTIKVEPEAAAVGIVALLREPGGRIWRVAKSISPGSTVTVNARLGPGGLSA